MWVYRLISATRPALGLFWKFRFIGAVESIPSKGPALVVANHACFLDPWFLCLNSPRRIRFLITREWYYKSPGWRRFFAAQGTVPVQEGPDATVKSVCEWLSRGEVIGVFPEGRISPDGRMQKFRTGICHLAAYSGVPVIPVGIVGAYQSLPRQRRFPRPGPVTMRVGEPVRFPRSPWTEKPPNELVWEFRDLLFRSIRGLAEQEELPARAPRAGRPVEVAEAAIQAGTDQTSSSSSTP